MANVIKIKRSAVQGKVPLTTDLQLGELAVNTYDGRLYTLKNDGTNAVVRIGGNIVDADISATAEIAVSKLANGTARQLLQTDAAGTGVEWTSNVSVPGTLGVTGLTSIVSTARSGAASSTTVPIGLYSGTSTYTDNTTAASGTAAHGTVVSLDNPAIAATNTGVTYTNASTLYIDGAPTAGTNVTITNAYSLYIATGSNFIGGFTNLSSSLSVGSGTRSSGALTTAASSKITVGTGIYTDTATAASGTVAFGTMVSLNSSAIAATNTGVTYTTAASLYVGGAPTAGTNVTITSPYSLYVAAGNNFLGSNTGIGGAPSTLLHVHGIARIGAPSTNDAELQVGAGATGNRNAYIDLVGDTTYTDYGLRLIRDNTGANATSWLRQRGTGTLYIATEEAAPIVLRTTNLDRMTVDSSGLIVAGLTPTNYANYTSPRLLVNCESATDASSVIIGDRTAGGANPTISLFRRDGVTAGATYGYRISEILADLVFENASTAAQAGGHAWTERARIDSAGRVLIGPTAARTSVYGNIGYLQIEGASGATRSIQLTHNGANFSCNAFTFIKTRGSSTQAVQSGDSIGLISWQATDGSSYIEGALIQADVDGTTGAGSVPTKLSFRTTPASSSTALDRIVIKSTGNVGIGTDIPAYKLEVNGSFAATTKSFVIPHPTKKKYKLCYGSLEGPENGVYVRGRSTEKVIKLPSYWRKLVDPDSITVTLTPIGGPNTLWIKSIKGNKVYVESESEDIEYFYVVFAERADVDKLEVEVRM